MQNTLSFQNKVTMDIGIVPESIHFGDLEIEISVRGVDNSFGFVSYATKKELQVLLEKGAEIMAEFERREAEKLLKGLK